MKNRTTATVVVLVAIVLIAVGAIARRFLPQAPTVSETDQGFQAPAAPGGGPPGN